MTGKQKAATPVFLFDLDGTLIDSVYQHVLSWREALETLGVKLSNWKIHRRIGMSGGLIIHAFARETGHNLSSEEAEQLQKLHGEAYGRRQKEVKLLPGAKELLAGLDKAKVKWAIATSGKRDKAQFALDMLGVSKDVTVITRDDVERAKPAPDLFLASAQRMGVDLGDCVVVGDSVWDLLAARRARALGVGLLSGGYGSEELYQAGAYRVYADPADLLTHMDEVGVRVG